MQLLKNTVAGEFQTQINLKTAILSGVKSSLMVEKFRVLLII